MNLPGVLLLILPAALWMAVAIGFGEPAMGRRRRATKAFGVGMLAFLAALAVQEAFLRGGKVTDLRLLPGLLTTLVLIGPSEELCKAALVRWMCQPAAGFGSRGEAVMCGVAAAAGEPFLEQFFLFIAPATPLNVLLDKALLGVALGTLCSIFWSARMKLAGGPESSGWGRGILVAGLVHGVYDVGSMLPSWTGWPLQVAYVSQTIVVAALAVVFARRVQGLAPGAPDS